MAVSLHEIRERYLECSVCFQEYDNDKKLPRFLPCNHTFCETCLQTLKLNSVIKCPQCNQEHRVEEIDNLPKDNTRRDLKDFLDENKEEPIKYQRCNTCQENTPARLYCNICDLFLCLGCFKEKHKFEGQTAHCFIIIQHEEFLPDTFNTCKIPGHEKGRLKYFSKSDHPGKPACASCILEENAEIITTKFDFGTDILEKRYEYISKETYRLSSKKNEIFSQSSLIDKSTEELNFQISLLIKRAGAVYSSDTYKEQNDNHISDKINRAAKNDRHILDAAKRNMKERLARINEINSFLDCISDIEDALLFFELYTYIKEIVDDICGMPIKNIDFTNISALNKCSRMLDEMEKDITIKEEENMRKKQVILQKQNTKNNDSKSETIKGILSKFHLENTSSKICIVILVFVAVRILLQLPAKWLFGANHFPDMKLVSPPFHPSLEIDSNNKTMLFNENGFKFIHGTYGNIHFGDNNSHKFMVRLFFEITSKIYDQIVFVISFSGYEKSEFEMEFSEHTEIWSLIGLACFQNSRICIGTKEGNEEEIRNIRIISSANKSTVYSGVFIVKVNPSRKQIIINIENSDKSWILNNVGFGRGIRPVFQFYDNDNINASFTLLTNLMKFDKKYAHPSCWISADQKKLKKIEKMATHHSINYSVKSIHQAMKQFMYPGPIADIKIVSDSEVYYVIDIIYDGEPFIESLPIFEIGILSLGFNLENKNKVLFSPSIIGYYCEGMFGRHCFKPNDCLHCDKSLPSSQILAHVYNGFISFYSFPNTQALSVLNINTSVVPFLALFVPERGLRLTIRTGNDIRFQDMIPKLYSDFIANLRIVLLYSLFFFFINFVIQLISECLTVGIPVQTRIRRVRGNTRRRTRYVRIR